MFSYFPFLFVVSSLSPPQKKSSHFSMYEIIHTCCFKVSCCMKLRFIKQWLTSACFVRCGSAQSKDKLSAASDWHIKKEEDQNLHNTAKDRYPLFYSILFVGVASFSSGGMNASFREWFTVWSSLYSTPSLSISPSKLACLQWCYFVNVYIYVCIYMYL